jgi:hypothetical protein
MLNLAISAVLTKSRKNLMYGRTSELQPKVLRAAQFTTLHQKSMSKFLMLKLFNRVAGKPAMDDQATFGQSAAPFWK